MSINRAPPRIFRGQTAGKRLRRLRPFRDLHLSNQRQAPEPLCQPHRLERLMSKRGEQKRLRRFGPVDEYLEGERIRYAIRLSAIRVLQETDRLPPQAPCRSPVPRSRTILCELHLSGRELDETPPGGRQGRIESQRVYPRIGLGSRPFRRLPPQDRHHAEGNDGPSKRIVDLRSRSGQRAIARYWISSRITYAIGLI